MFLVANYALELLVNASVQGTEGSAILASDGAGGEGRANDFRRCHCEDRDGRWRLTMYCNVDQLPQGEDSVRGEEKWN